MRLKQGDIAPSFSLQSTSGEEVDLASLRGSKILLYFYHLQNLRKKQLEFFLF